MSFVDKFSQAAKSGVVLLLTLAAIATELVRQAAIAVDDAVDALANSLQSPKP